MLKSVKLYNVRITIFTWNNRTSLLLKKHINLMKIRYLLSTYKVSKIYLKYLPRLSCPVREKRKHKNLCSFSWNCSKKKVPSYWNNSKLNKYLFLLN